MFDDGSTADQAARWMDSMEDAPLLLVFGVPFMLFAPLGLLIMTIGSLVTKPFPRWTAGTWLAFVVLDFGFSLPARLDAHWLYSAAAVGLAAPPQGSVSGVGELVTAGAGRRHPQLDSMTSRSRTA